MAQQTDYDEIMQWVRPQPTVRERIWRSWRHKPLGLVGLGLLLVLALMAAFAPWITPFDPLDMHPPDRLQGPNSTYWMGTDQFGRDMFTRLVFGTRISLFMGFAAITIGGVTGGLFGLTSAYVGGKFDLITQRFVDVLQAFPSLVLAMAVVAALGFGVINTALAIAIPRIDNYARIVRSQALAVRNREYTLAAKSIGASTFHIIRRHMIPNSMAPWLIVATAGLGSAVVAEASLSFLGLGVPPPHPSWGRMLSGSVQQYAEIAPHLIIFPGVFLSLTVFGFNLFGDAIRDVMDPRLRR